jgi:hypothetical protein
MKGRLKEKKTKERTIGGKRGKGKSKEEKKGKRSFNEKEKIT